MENKGLSKAQKQVNRYFPKKPIAYQPGLSLVLKSVPAGLLLSQLLYWHGKGSNEDGWVYKTIEDIRAETGLSRYQQDTAIKVCKKFGILEMKLAGIPAKRHFRIRLDNLVNLLPSLKEQANIAWANPPSQFVENQQTNTNNTQKTTSNNTHINYKSSNHARAGPVSSIGEIAKCQATTFPNTDRKLFRGFMRLAA